MMTKIGIVAGKILTLLEDYGSAVTLREIELYLDEPVDLVLMGIGWLSRESYITLRMKENAPFVYLISLKEGALRSKKNQQVELRKRRV